MAMNYGPLPWLQENERELVVLGELELELFPGDILICLHGIAVNTEGQIVVTDSSDDCVYVFDENGSCLRKTGGSGSNTGQFRCPNGISFLNDNEVLIADSGNYRIQRLNIQTGNVVQSFGQEGTEQGEFGRLMYVTVNNEKSIVVTDYGNNRIQVMSNEGESIFTFGNEGLESLRLRGPTCCIRHEDKFFVSDTGNNCIKAFDQSGTFLFKFGNQGNLDGQFREPHGLLVDSSNNLLVCDFGNNRVQQFSLDGRFTGRTITNLPKPVAITKAPDGRILVTSNVENKVYILQ